MIDVAIFSKAFSTLWLSKGKQPDSGIMQTWYALVKDHEQSKVLDAMKRLIYDADDFPTVGKLLNEINGNLKVRVAEAWNWTLDACRYGSVPSDALIADAVRKIGGADAIGYAQYGYELDQKRKQFCEIYGAMLEQADKQESARQISAATKQITEVQG